MKTLSLLVLLVLVTSVSTPFAMPLTGDDSDSSLMALDVCSRNQVALSLNDESPVLQEASLVLALFSSDVVFSFVSHDTDSPLFVFQDEKPPEA